MQPFKIAIAEEQLVDLRRRLKATRFPDTLEDIGWEYGTDIGFLRRFVAHWADNFDWRAAEQRLNDYPHFLAEIDGETVHFLHIKGEGQQRDPLLLTNGWPSNFVELLPLVPLLTQAENGISFDLVIPSLQGFGFSSRPRQRGMNLTRMAHLWAKLMSDLGYERFVFSGTDMGAGVGLGLVRNHPDRIHGAHYVNVYSQYPRPADPTLEEEAYFQQIDYWGLAEGGYAMLQGTKPQSLAPALNDSPAGLAAWALEKFHGWSALAEGGIEATYQLDDLCTLLSVYWFTETIGSSIRLYKEAFADEEFNMPMPKHGVPQGVMVPGPADSPAPRAWGERHLQNLVHWSEIRQGGHFPALEVPELLAADIRAFHNTLS